METPPVGISSTPSRRFACSWNPERYQYEGTMVSTRVECTAALTNSIVLQPHLNHDMVTMALDHKHTVSSTHTWSYTPRVTHRARRPLSYLSRANLGHFNRKYLEVNKVLGLHMITSPAAPE